MSDLDFEELCRLAEIYRDFDSTNPCKILQRADLAPSDAIILRSLVERSNPSRVSEWRGALGTKPGSTKETLSKEEYLNVAGRDFRAAKGSAVLSFVLAERLAPKSSK